jgi:hypothetical protein
LKSIKWTGHIAKMREKKSAYTLLVGKREGKSILGRPGCGWVDNIEMGLAKVG